MKITCLRLIATCAALCVSGSALAVDVSLGDWLHEDTEGLSSISGSGDTFTASPGNTASATNPFAARQKVYQIFGQAVDFSNTGDEISIVFDVVMNGVPDINDTDFRMSMIDTSTNQGIYPFSFDLGGRVGTYNRARFVDQLDGDLDDGPDAWGGSLIDAINGDGTVAQSPGGGPTIENGAEELGLVQGNTMHFDVYLRRESNGAIFFSTLVTEANGDVTYPEVAGTYDPVNPTSGDTTVRGEAIDQFDGIVFGIFDDAPFLQDGDYNGDGDVNAADYTLWRDNVGQDEGTLPNDPNNDGGVIGDDQYNTWRDQYGASDGSYTVSNLSVVASSLVPASSAASSAPEPAAALLALIGGVAFVGRRTNRG